MGHPRTLEADKTRTGGKFPPEGPMASLCEVLLNEGRCPFMQAAHQYIIEYDMSVHVHGNISYHSIISHVTT